MHESNGDGESSGVEATSITPPLFMYIDFKVGLLSVRYSERIHCTYVNMMCKECVWPVSLLIYHVYEILLS